MQAAKKGLWLACIGYDPKFGTEFSTYAYKAIFSQVMNELGRKKTIENSGEYRLISMQSPASGKEDMTDPGLFGDAFVGSTDSGYDMVETMDYLKKTLTPNEFFIVMKLYEGYSQREIEKMLGLGRSVVCQRVKKIRKKLEEIRIPR